MYVAITRARKRLYITHSQSRMLHGQVRYNVKSRFLDEMPEEAVKWLTPPRRQTYASWDEPSTKPSAASSWSESATSRRTKPNQDAWLSSLTTKTSKVTTIEGVELGKGDAVFHVKFGEGRVLAIEGQGNDAKIQINFGRHGNKWLALSVVKLQKID